MPPFRGSRGNRGGRGGRGRGRGRGRGGAASNGGSERIARSGIRTKSGYRKFDSQRVKEVQPGDSGSEAFSQDDEPAEEDLDTSEESDDGAVANSYSALLQSFQSSVSQDGRNPKRRKIAAANEDEDVGPARDHHEPDDDNASEVSGSVGSADDALDDSAAEDEPDATGPRSEDETDDASDPYLAHFASPDNAHLDSRISSIQKREWRVEKRSVPDVGTVTVSIPAVSVGNSARRPNVKSLDDISLKHRLAQSARNSFQSLDKMQQTIAPYVTNYSDLLVGNRTAQNAASLRSMACLHSINHILKGRDRVLKNNSRLSHAAEGGPDLDLRDQGFTRPKVLLLLETRQMCAKYVAEIISLYQPEQQENKKRFHDTFESELDDRDSWSDDYRELFEGNNDNNFLTALKFTRKTLKFYSAFYASDIILASPLGLRRVLENEDLKKRDHDFLSSIEVVIADQADAMQMQDWSNVEIVFDHLNLQLREAHGCDFTRVRSWYLDGNAKYLRQTIVFSAYVTPEMNKLYNTCMLNIEGKAKLMPSYDGAITSVSTGMKQTFSRFDSNSPAAEPDARFKYFTSAVLPNLLRLPRPADGAQGILVYVPSYYDFLRLRNFFATSTATQDVSFGAIHDYSAISDQRRARSHFLSGRHSILLYTQRAHHFFRLKIRGVKRLVWYGLPSNPIFYDELVGGYLGTSLSEGRVSAEESSARCLFSKWDGLALERVVGTQRVKGMLGGAGDTFDFV